MFTAYNIKNTPYNMIIWVENNEFIIKKIKYWVLNRSFIKLNLHSIK